MPRWASTWRRKRSRADWQPRSTSIPPVWVDSSYENVRAECPWCRRESIFNRPSDLNGAVAIANMTVECLREECGKLFVIIGDSAAESFEMLLFDTYEIIDAKRYIGRRAEERKRTRRRPR